MGLGNAFANLVFLTPGNERRPSQRPSRVLEIVFLKQKKDEGNATGASLCLCGAWRAGDEVGVRAMGVFVWGSRKVVVAMDQAS